MREQVRRKSDISGILSEGVQFESELRHCHIAVHYEMRTEHRGC